ncbi:hypothetical protein FRB90_000272 [Tulasnella sp. 427]|nr:hypothetical protein FRB90_000272 [Tulasnella sp. 427]
MSTDGDVQRTGGGSKLIEEDYHPVDEENISPKEGQAQSTACDLTSGKKSHERSGGSSPSTTLQEVESAPGPAKAPMSKPPARTRDFGIIPIPYSRQYHPERPFHFTMTLNIIFGFASTTTVANLYYCQPLLVNFASAFNVSNDDVSTIPTITQAGYAAGLLLITPLGDLVRRRPLLLTVLTLSIVLTMGVALSPNLVTFQILSFFLGTVTVTPQILIPFAGDLAPAERRASALSIVLSGLILGVIMARALGGIVADASGSWKNVYWIGMGLQATALGLLWWILPDWPSKVELLATTQDTTSDKKPLSYFTIFSTMAKVAVTEPALIQGCIIGLVNQMVFSGFWVTLTFLLTDAPYHYSTLKIGIFGLVGILGVITAPLVGRLIDKLVLWIGIFVSACALMLSQVLMVGAAGINIGAIIVACFGLQMQQVSVTTKIYQIDPALRARVNAVYMISAFIGQVVGSAVASHIFLRDGWRAAYGASLGFVGIVFLALLVRGPHVSRHTWFGWEGGARLTKKVSQSSSSDVEMGARPSQSLSTSP